MVGKRLTGNTTQEERTTETGRKSQWLNVLTHICSLRAILSTRRCSNRYCDLKEKKKDNCSTCFIDNMCFYISGFGTGSTETGLGFLRSCAVWDSSDLKGKISVIRNHGSVQRLLNREWVNFPGWWGKSTVGAVNAEPFISSYEPDSWRLSKLRSNSLSSRHWTLFPFCLFFPLSLFHTRRQLLCLTWRP